MSTETSGIHVTILSNENITYNMVSDGIQLDHNIKPLRPFKKGTAFGKRSNSMKRNQNAEVTKMGWLLKQASSGMKQWNKRWFVLVDRCLFYYKDEKEEVVLGSIPLQSFHISHLQPSDNISRKHTFKVTVCQAGDEFLHKEAQMSRQAEHAGIRIYYFSAESQEEQESWLREMGEASQAQNPSASRKDTQDSENIISSTYHYPETQSRGEGDGRGSEKLEWRSECKNSFLSGVKGSETSSDRILDLEASRPEVVPTTQPSGWDCVSLPVQPASTGFSEQSQHSRSILPCTHPEKVSQRQNSMSQLQQWVNLRRAAAPTEEIQRPNRYIPGPHSMKEYYPLYPSQYPDGYQYCNPAGSRPDSIALSTFDRSMPHWDLEGRHQALNRASYQTCEWKDPGAYGRQGELWNHHPPFYYQEADAVCETLQRLSLQPCSRSVPRSPSHVAYSTRQRFHSPNARFETESRNESFREPAAYTMRCSLSSPKYEYDYSEDRPPLPVGMYRYSYPTSPPPHSKMMTESETLISMVNNMVHSSPRAQIFMQVSPYADPYREALQSYKFHEQDADKLLGKLCEQHKVVREQDRLVQQLRAEKESLESALMGTHQEMEMFGNQTAFTEKLQRRKESLQNQLISIRVELSQATTALNKSTVQYEVLEEEVSALHDAFWEQLNLNIQNELMNRHIQREIWRIQDVMEGLRKHNPSRGTDTAKHRVVIGPSATFRSNSPASPLSSASLTSPLSPFSLISGSQGSPTKHTTSEDTCPPRPPLPLSYTLLDSPPAVPPPPVEDPFKPWPYPVSLYSEVKLNLEPYKKESTLFSSALPNEDVHPIQTTGIDTEKEWQLQHQVVNKVGIVPPWTKSPNEEGPITKPLVIKRGANAASNRQISKERPKSALFSVDIKSKMSVEEQIDRMKQHQSGFVKEKRRSFQLPSGQQRDSNTTKSASTYQLVRRHRSIYEEDISGLEAAIRSQEPQNTYESPREEIARLRNMELEPQALNADINRELYASDKVIIPERYHDMEPEIPLSPEELQEKQRKLERIKTLIAKSSLQNVIPLSDSELEMPPDSDSQLQEQEKRIELTCALAAEASRRGRLLSALCATPSPPTSPTSPGQQTLSCSKRSDLGGGSSSSDSSGEYGATIMCV